MPSNLKILEYVRAEISIAEYALAQAQAQVKDQDTATIAKLQTKFNALKEMDKALCILIALEG